MINCLRCGSEFDSKTEAEEHDLICETCRADEEEQ